MSNLILENVSTPIAVNKVRIEGISHTNHEFLYEFTKELLHATTVGDVIIGSRNVGATLLQFHIFKDLQIELDADPELPGTVDVIYKVIESPRFYASTGADFGANDTAMNLSLNIRNVFGNAETISCVSSYGVDNTAPINEGMTNTLSDDRSNAMQMYFRKPLNSPQDILEISTYKLDKSHQYLMSYFETLRGISVSRSFPLGMGHYKYGYLGVWRENHSLADNASIKVRLDAGHSLKSSIFHEITFDSRDDPVLPAHGNYVNFHQEIAGLGGNTKFFKNEFNGISTISLPFGLSLSGSWRWGAMIPIQKGDLNRPRINDRFTIGGPNSLRGFRPGCVGPRDKDNFLGGNCYNSFGLDLAFPLPFLPPHFVKGHGFLNAGVLSIVNTREQMSDFIQSFRNASTAAGVGIVARFAGFRLELNYCVPLNVNSNDIAKPGFQFGIGMNFM